MARYTNYNHFVARSAVHCAIYNISPLSCNEQPKHTEVQTTESYLFHFNCKVKLYFAVSTTSLLMIQTAIMCSFTQSAEKLTIEQRAYFVNIMLPR